MQTGFVFCRAICCYSFSLPNCIVWWTSRAIALCSRFHLLTHTSAAETVFAHVQTRHEGEFNGSSTEDNLFSYLDPTAVVRLLTNAWTPQKALSTVAASCRIALVFFVLLDSIMSSHQFDENLAHCTPAPTCRLWLNWLSLFPQNGWNKHLMRLAAAFLRAEKNEYFKYALELFTSIFRCCWDIFQSLPFGGNAWYIDWLMLASFAIEKPVENNYLFTTLILLLLWFLNVFYCCRKRVLFYGLKE